MPSNISVVWHPHFPSRTFVVKILFQIFPVRSFSHKLKIYFRSLIILNMSRDLSKEIKLNKYFNFLETFLVDIQTRWTKHTTENKWNGEFSKGFAFKHFCDLQGYFWSFSEKLFSPIIFFAASALFCWSCRTEKYLENNRCLENQSPPQIYNHVSDLHIEIMI